MSERLAHWLEHHEATIVPRWARRIRERGVSDERLGTADLRQRFFVQLYAGLIDAARGEYDALTTALSAMTRLSNRADKTLPNLLELPFQLRRIAWDIALHDDEPQQMLQLLAELEPLTEWIVGVLSRQFGHEIERALQQRIDEAEFMATQLAVATEEADHVALRVNRLYQFSQAISGNLQLHDLLNSVGQEVQQALGADRCAIWLRADQQLFNARAWGYTQALNTIRYALDEPTLVPQALQRATPWLLADPSSIRDGGWVDPQAALLALPLHAADDKIGVIVVQRGQGQPSSEQIALAQSLASQAALAIENARLYDQIVQMNAELEQRIQARTQELRAERDRLELLYATSSAVSSTLDVDTLLGDLLAVLAQRLNVTHGSVMLIDNETGQLVRRAALGESVHEATPFMVGSGVAGWVAEHHQPALIDDVTRDPRWIEPGPPLEAHKRTGSLLAVPLLTSDDLLGVLTLSHPSIGYFEPEQLRALVVIANEVAVALRNADLYGFISDQAARLATMVEAERAASSQSQAILQSIADGVLVCDVDGQVILVNAASARILDQTQEDLSLANVHDLLRTLPFTGPEQFSVRELLAAPQDDQGQPRQMHAQFRIGPRSVAISVGPVLTEHGELLGGVAVLRDITREIEADRLKTEFIGTVSHELRTPMTVIKGYVQLLGMSSMGELTPMQRQLVDTIKTSAERMTSIVNDLLDITKIESGSVELEFKPVNVLEAISLAVNNQQPQIEARQHRLALDVPADLPAMRADIARLQQVLDNLLSNAIKYSPRNGALTIAARPIQSSDVPEPQRNGLSSRRSYIAIAVSDTGIGVAPEDQERIFDRFYRVESALKVEAGGTGLGLAIVKPLVTLMGGRIWIESVLDHGSTFTLVLPTI